MSIIGSGLAVEVSAPIAGGPNDTSTRTPAEAARNWRRDRHAVLTGDAANRRREHWVRAMLKSALWTWNRQLLVVELVALRRVAPRRAAQGTIKRKRPSGAAHSVCSARTGLSQRDKHHLQEMLNPPRRRFTPRTISVTWRVVPPPSGLGTRAHRMQCMNLVSPAVCSFIGTSALAWLVAEASAQMVGPNVNV